MSPKHNRFGAYFWRFCANLPNGQSEGTDRGFLCCQGGGGLDPGKYCLVAQFPRRVVLPTAQDSTLEAVGLSASQEALVVELWEP